MFFFDLNAFFIVTLVIVVCEASEKNYRFTPRSNHYDINEGETFSVYFEEIGNKTDFDYCYYRAENASRSFQLRKNTRNYYSRDYSPNKNETKCGFTVEKADAKTPLKWVVSAHDLKNNQNYTEEVTVDLYYNAEPLLKNINVLKGASYLNYLKPNKDTYTKCALLIDESRVELKIKTKERNDTSVFQDRLSSLGGGKCGFRITNAQPGDPNELILIATNEEQKNYRTKIKMSVFALDNLSVNRSLEESLGKPLRFYCGIERYSAINSEQQYCFLYNPRGELVSKKQLCEYRLDILTREDLGVWSCLVGYRFTMEPVYFTTEIKEKTQEHVELWSNKNNEVTEIGCKLVNYNLPLKLSFCKFTRPDGVIFKTYEGAASERYTSLKTNLVNGLCGIEIQNPLLEHEKGTWKCEISSRFDATGGFINVEKSSVDHNIYKIHTKINVRLKSKFQIACQVPYSSDFCYVIAPNKTQYESSSKSTLGECSFEVDKAQISDNGTWSCYFSRGNGFADEKIAVDVSVIEMKLLCLDAEAYEDESVGLVCNTGGIPIENCRFVSPNDVMYSLREGESKTNVTGYFGRGLSYGDCGLKIFKTNYYRDNGKWICHVKIGKEDITIKKELHLTVYVSRVNIIESLGISVGIFALISAAALVVFYKKRRNSGINVEYMRDPTSESGDEISVILDTEQNDYNTNFKND